MSAGAHKDKEDAPQKTGGEVLFDQVAYFGIGWIVNALISVKMTDMAVNDKDSFLYKARTKAVDKFQDVAMNIGSDDAARQQAEAVAKAISQAHPEFNTSQTPPNKFFYEQYTQHGNSFETLASETGFDANTIKSSRDFIVGQERNKTVAESLANIITLCGGGFLLMAPIKWMEDKKRPITQFLDEKVVDPFNEATGKAPISEIDRIEQQEKRQERYDFLDNAPKQTWGSILGSRIVTLLPIYALHMAWNNPENVIKSGLKPSDQKYANPDPEVGFGGVEHHLRSMTDTVAEKALDFKPVDKFVSKNFTDHDAFKQQFNWLATDLSYSLIAAKATYAFTRVLGPMLDKGSHEQTAATSPQATTMQTPTAIPAKENAGEYSNMSDKALAEDLSNHAPRATISSNQLQHTAPPEQDKEKTKESEMAFA